MKDVKKLSQEQIIEEIKKIPLPLSSEKDSEKLSCLMRGLDNLKEVPSAYLEEILNPMFEEMEKEDSKMVEKYGIHAETNFWD